MVIRYLDLDSCCSNNTGYHCQINLVDIKNCFLKILKEKFNYSHRIEYLKNVILIILIT